MLAPAGWEGAELALFDCDSTLTRLEGIDELARRRGIDVSAITTRAMSGESPLEELYGQRLEQIRPTTGDLAWLAGRYWDERVSGVERVIGTLQAEGVACHVVSGGLLPAVMPFAERIGFAHETVWAVPFNPPDADDEAGWSEAIEAASAHPLARSGGKSQVVTSIAERLGIPRERRVLVGDGASDLEAADAVGLLVGFGGVRRHEVVERGADVYLTGPTLDPVLALVDGSPSGPGSMQGLLA